MSEARFDRVFNGLTPERRKVLEKFLAGDTDEAITKSLFITKATVRQHLRNIWKAFGSENRLELMALFAQYKPELIGNRTPVETIQPEDVPQTTTIDPNFVGREEAIEKLNNFKRQGAKVILIQARGGVGKTTLARKYLEREFPKFIEFSIAKETQNITLVESLVQEKLRQLGEEPGREFGVSLERLKQKLQTTKIGVLIDNLEPALDEDGRFIEKHRSYVELLRVLAEPSVQSLTLITSRERLHECDFGFQTYKLEGLSLEAWQQYFDNRQIKKDFPALEAINKAYGGNAKVMEIINSSILMDFSGNLEAYWQVNQADLLCDPTLEYLVRSQFERLQTMNANAYKLLCRMGCYRYQDVPTVPREGLFCLLWDVPERQQRVVNALCDRSLVEFDNGEYFLHPVIRAEAIGRLRKSQDWETANYTAAEFWTDSVETVETVEDALRAFEAYYHYIKIKNFILAGTIIINPRANKWEETEPLGRSFYRLGLLQQMIYSINFIINHIEPSYVLSRLHNILGDLYWLTGNIRQAIVSHEKSGTIAYKSLENFTDTENIKFWLKRLIRYYLFNTALCYLDIWEFKEAIKLFEEVKILWEDTHYSNVEKGIYVSETPVDTWSCLAFLNSCIGSLQKAYNLTENAYFHLTTAKLDSWCTGYAPLFLGLTYKNLLKIEKSFEMYNRAIAYAEESQYTQVKAKALYGMAELYRIQGEFTAALSHHTESIELLEKIGAKCDLAEAYFQFALTHQKLGDMENSQINFDKAIKLFKEMEAPKQVERVRAAMENKESH